MANALRGQSSGDFKETSSRVQLFHVVTRNSVGALTTDAFTQANPPVITGSSYKSTTLSGITKVGVLGGSVAFTRPQAGNNLVGGPVVTAGPTYLAGVRPLGIFLNDAVGNSFENTPGVASGRGPYVCGSGSCVGVSVYETQNQSSGAVLTYAAGDRLYASANGLLTNRLADAYEMLVAGAAQVDVTVVGIVKAIPDSTNPWLVLDLRVLALPRGNGKERTSHEHGFQRDQAGDHLQLHQDRCWPSQACGLDDPAAPVAPRLHGRGTKNVSSRELAGRGLAHL
jgi:hypothetical protein